MFRGLSAWVRGHKAVASIVAVVLVVGVPATFAVLHKGFPVDNVDLSSRDVWVTNADQLLGGRLNHQIDELDASVTGSSKDLDVLQNGGAYFLTDVKNGTVDRIDQAYSTLIDRISIPPSSEVAYGGQTLAILSPSGSLWVLDASGRLDFDPAKTRPTEKLGADAHIAVSTSGITFAVAPKKRRLVTVQNPGAQPTSVRFPAVSTYQLSTVGDQPVVLDITHNTAITADGTAIALPHKAMQLQQSSHANDYALVASGTGLLEVPLRGGGVRSVPAGVKQPVTSASEISAPVWLNGCAYGAWAGASRYLYACDGRPATALSIAQQVAGDDLRFRVNHDVIALNNLQNGDAWVVSSQMRLVQNWASLKPDTVTKQGSKGEEKPVLQSFSDTLAHRTKINHPPKAVDDQFGIRAGRSTELPVLANDTDPDGDVLSITDVGAIPASQGTLQVIDGGRSIQLTPTPALSGTVSFRYTIDDGRGGTASAQVNATVHPESENAAPRSIHVSNTQVEVGQSISHNVLNDWLDPDGDGLTLADAEATTDDTVQFAPDGTVTFTSTNGQAGSKQVRVTVSDGHLSATGTLTVTVKPGGTLAPVATPDFATGFVGDPVVVHPLENDLSPSGDPLSLIGAAEDSGPAATVTTDPDQSTVTLEGYAAGEYYVRYTLGAGAKSTDGLIRVNLTDRGSEAAPIAVTDTVYVRPGESSSVNVLGNDSSPSGRVLAVQSVSSPPDAQSLNVEVLDNAVVKVTAPGVLSGQVQLKYVVSDGTKSATAGITVVPVPPLVTHQTPIANDDTVTVRAGDVATVPVLDNDVSPDAEPFTLDPTLHDTSRAGSGATAFVSGSNVRYQAPRAAGQYSVTYGITDKFGQKAQADVIFVVTAPPTSAVKDLAPRPKPLTVRVFAGSTVPITVPLDGIDPDGDSVALDGITGSPKLGEITGSSSTSFTYQAYPESGGTDGFRYRVTDTYGKSATGTVRVGVIPRPATLAPPIAVNDTIEVKPGKTASVPVLNNDSDPNGFPIQLSTKLSDIDHGLTATVHGQFVLVTAPQKEGVYQLRYQIDNGHGGQASAYVQVTVTKDAKPQYPTAADQDVEPGTVAGKSSVKVDVFDGAVNPSGLVDDLRVSVSGANASYATVGTGGSVTVRPQERRMAITYALTDPATGLKGEAFIVVPPKTSKAKNDAQSQPTPQPQHDASKAPYLNPNLPAQIVTMNGHRTWNLADILVVPSGRPVTLSGAATASHGTSPSAGRTAIGFSAATGYRGPGSVRFTVDDGRDSGAKVDRLTTIVLPVTVGNADQSDVPPTFTPPNVTIEPGEAARTIDLRGSTYHPNPKVKASITYTNMSGATSAVQASLSGSTLSLSSPLGTQPGGQAKIAFNVNSGSYIVKGWVNVTVVSSTRPLASQKVVPQKSDVKRANSVTLPNVVSTTQWTNPFPGTALKIVAAKAVTAPAGVHVTYTGSTITTAVDSGAALGTVNVQYTVQDATNDPQRRVVGQYQVTVHDVPAAPPPPTIVSAADGAVTVKIASPKTDNGRPVTGYVVSDGSKKVGSTKVGNVTFSGLTNGTKYRFQVQAVNSDGSSPYSGWSAYATPYGTPAKVGTPHLSSSSSYYTATVTLIWPALSGSATGGGAVTYYYKVAGGPSGSTSGTSKSFTVSKAATLSAQVRAYNPHSKVYGPWSNVSNTVKITKKPLSYTVNLSRGTGPVRDSGCSYGCFYYKISVSSFPQGTYTIHYYCTDEVSYSDTMKVGANGTGSFNSDASGTSHFRCGYTTHVTVGGHPSNTVSFTP